MVSESLVARARVNEVARRHGVTAQQVSSWRGLARRGELELGHAQGPHFATVEVVEGSREVGAVAIEAFGSRKTQPPGGQRSQ